MSTSQALRLIPLLYDAAGDPALWPEALAKTGEALGAVGKVLTVVDLRSGKDDMAVAVGIDPEYQRLYEEYYESINIHIQRARPLLVPRRVLATHQFCSEKETLSSEYYEDFLRPQDGWFHIVGGCVAKEKSLLSVISFMRGRRAGHFDNPEIELLEILMPHFQRAVQLGRKLGRQSDLAECLDRIATAVLLVKGDSRVQFYNRAAEDIFQRQDGIGMDRKGCLVASNHRVADLIARTSGVAAGHEAVSPDSVLVPRPSGKRPYTLSVSPIRGCNPFVPGCRPGAVVMVTDPEEGLPLSDFLSRLYGLTATESRLAALLVEGKDLKQIGEEMGIARNTVRTHVSHVRDKLRVKRQAEIVSVVLKSLGAVRL